MVNLWGLAPVLAGWGIPMAALPDALKKEDGVSLHGGLDEHSLMLHLKPSLVAPGYRTATLEVLGGTDPATYTRYLSYLVKMPLYQGWIRAAEDRDRALGDKQRVWLERRRAPR